jgi:hypothetical protein
MRVGSTFVNISPTNFLPQIDMARIQLISKPAGFPESVILEACSGMIGAFFL